MLIVPDILDLDQYLKAQKETPERFRPIRCSRPSVTIKRFSGQQ
ncbi:hypothetical protein GAMM_280005 [Gammaproteobacteria bacterium]